MVCLTKRRSAALRLHETYSCSLTDRWSQCQQQRGLGLALGDDRTAKNLGNPIRECVGANGVPHSDSPLVHLLSNVYANNVPNTTTCSGCPDDWASGLPSVLPSCGSSNIISSGYANCMYLKPECSRLPTTRQMDLKFSVFTRNAATSALFSTLREISRFERVRGGPGRTRTSNQTVMSGRL